MTNQSTSWRDLSADRATNSTTHLVPDLVEQTRWSARPVRDRATTTRRIVVGTDDSYWGRAALRWAARYAWLADSELDVRSPDTLDLDEIQRLSPTVDVHTHTCADLAVELLDASAETALVVLGRRSAGHRGLGLGTAVVPVSAHARCDVVVVGGSQQALLGTHQRITALVGAEPDEPALRSAGRHALLGQTELVLRRAVPAAAPLAGRAAEQEQSILDKAADLVYRWAPTVPVRTELRWSTPLDTIAAATDSDLLIVGTDGDLTPLARAALHHAPCPVVVTHQPVAAIPPARPQPVQESARS